jgi:poly(A) polymerase
VWDYHGGVADLKRRQLRMIGDPERRYREDPVRMLRAVRLSASRGLEIEAGTRRPIRRLAGLLAHVPPSRLLDEMLKLLLSGHSAAAVAQLRREGLHHGVLPLLDAAMGRAVGERFIVAALEATDERIRGGKTVSPGFLFAALLWPEVEAEWKVQAEKGMPEIPALYQAMYHVMTAQAGSLPIPHRYGADMREIWALQPRFLQRAGKRPYRLLEHPRFRAGYDFLLLRASTGDADAALGEWWKRFQHAGESERAHMLVSDGEPRKRRRRRRRKPRGEGAPGPAGGDPSPAG